MSSGYIFENRSELDTAVDLWISDEADATEIYGDINTWDVSRITDFSALFQEKENFNSNISDWNVSNGTNFSSMFIHNEVFNHDIRNWDVGNGNNFSYMFMDEDA